MDAALHISERSANLAARDLASDLLFQEAEALDCQNWTGWLALYHEDAEFWMPAWLDVLTRLARSRVVTIAAFGRLRVMRAFVATVVP